METQKQTGKNSTDVKLIVCFVCREVGHKCLQCPNRQKEKVKKVTIQAHLMERLATNDVMARFNDVRVPMTIDSGAEASIVPHELVRPQDFTGETIKCKGAFDKQVWTDARVASVNIVIGNESFQEKVLAVPVKTWVGLPFLALT